MLAGQSDTVVRLLRVNLLALVRVELLAFAAALPSCYLAGLCLVVFLSLLKS